MWQYTVLLFSAYLATTQAQDAGQINGYWGERGLSNPPHHLRGTADFSLLYFNNSGDVRPVLLVTIATPASIRSSIPRLLENLASFRTNDQFDTNGRTDTTLAEHTIVMSTNQPTQMECNKLTEKHKHKCYEWEHNFNQGVEDTMAIGANKANAYSIGLGRIKVLTDLVSLGYDILYFDAHHTFFQHPLKYLYSHTSAPIVVSSTKCQPLVPAADGSLPDDHHHLDILFMRSHPASFRCLFNWLYWSSHGQHDPMEKPLDHHTFRHVMNECVTSLGTDIFSVQYLDPDAFPSECFTKCGCNNNNPVEAGPDGQCPKDVMAKWVAYRFSCSGSASNVEGMMTKYDTMFKQAGLALPM